MKIARIDSIPLRIPFTVAAPAPTGGRGDWNAFDMLLVRVETEDGMVGWGDAFSYHCRDAVKAAVDTNGTGTLAERPEFKASRAATTGWPRGPTVTIRAAGSTASRHHSADGSACAMLPHTVPRLRTTGWATSRSA